MAHCFDGDTADEVWKAAAIALSNSPRGFNQPSRLGKIAEFVHASFLIRNPRQRWVHSRLPAINPAFAIAELVWVLAGREDSAFVNTWNPALPKFAGTSNTYYGAYGARLRSKFGFDQLVHAYKVLDKNPDSRQVVLQIWDSIGDLPETDGTPRSPDIPCNICSMLKIRNSALEWTQVMRSNDLFLGSPHNFVQFTSLQEILAGWLGLELGEYFQVCDSLHMYEHDSDKLSIGVATNSPVNKDDLRLRKPDFDKMFPSFMGYFDALTEPNLSVSQFRKLLKSSTWTRSYQNLALIAAADIARRNNWQDEKSFVIEECTNPTLVSLWKGWDSRIFKPI